MESYTLGRFLEEFEELNRTMKLILKELETANERSKPLKVVQKFNGPTAAKHGNNYNCGDGTGCRCGESDE